MVTSQVGCPPREALFEYRDFSPAASRSGTSSHLPLAGRRIYEGVVQEPAESVPSHPRFRPRPTSGENHTIADDSENPVGGRGWRVLVAILEKTGERETEEKREGGKTGECEGGG